MKRKKSLFSRIALTGLAALACFISAMPAAAAEESEVDDEGEDIILDDNEEVVTYPCGDYTYSILKDANDEEKRGVCIEEYAGSEENLVLPEQLDGLDVVQLGYRAFAGADYLKSVTLSKNIDGLGMFSFAECLNLETIEVDSENPFLESRDGMLYTKDGTTLLRCPIAKKLTEFTVPDGVTKLGDIAFSCMDTLTSIEIPDSVTEIGVAAFAECTSLSSVKLSNSLTLIPTHGFLDCTALKSIEIPDSVTEIGSAAFANTGLESVEIPDSVTKIGQQAFAATKLTEVTLLPCVTEIGYCAFGWYEDQRGEMAMDSNFTIHGYKGSAAQQYAIDAENGNKFNFEAMDEDETGNSTTATELPVNPDTGLGLGRIIGIVGSSVLIVLIIIAAIVVRKKPEDGEKKEKKSGKKKAEKDNDAGEDTNDAADSEDGGTDEED